MMNGQILTHILISHLIIKSGTKGTRWQTVKSLPLSLFFDYLLKTARTPRTHGEENRKMQLRPKHIIMSS